MQSTTVKIILHTYLSINGRIILIVVLPKEWLAEVLSSLVTGVVVTGAGVTGVADDGEFDFSVSADGSVRRRNSV